MAAMSSKKSIQNLGETIHSLLGFKSHLTSTWVKSVCEIVKKLPSGNEKDDESVAKEISKIKEEIAALTHCINQLNIQRRQLLHDLLDLKGNIRVFCRVRPFTLEESIGGGIGAVVALDTSNLLLKLGDNKTKRYTFDNVFQGSSQDGVFSEVEPVIKSVLDGYNACIFAYGQTGTGKTFTMEGTLDSPGIVPRTIETLFKQALDSNHTFLITFSMLEIYLGNLKDLLVPQATRATDPLPPWSVNHYANYHSEKMPADLDAKSVVFVAPLSMIRISMTCFDAPERRRETNKIWLVDLGGSERVVKTKAWGRRLDEGKAINLSLSALGDVIHALQRKKSHIPYRNSKLTQVLKDSLGEDSKTLMLVHVSPKEEDLCETICSLNFAARVKSVQLGHEESNVSDVGQVSHNLNIRKSQPKSNEVRNQKEAAMKNLQQTNKKIEDERRYIREKIQILNHKLEELTRRGLPLEQQAEACDLSTELGPPSELDLTKNRTGNVRSQLPRFMRSTISSRTKTGMEHQTSLHSRRRRRPSSQRAESVSFPVKNHSECNSDRSISRSTCAVELNRKTSMELDNVSVYSQDTSECDTITVVTNRKSNKSKSTKVLKVDQWLTLHKDEASISGSVPRNKWVSDIPLPEKKHRSNREKKTHILCNDKVFKKQKKASSEVAVSQRVEDKPPTLKDLFAEESNSSFICPPQPTMCLSTGHQQESLDGSLIEYGQGGSLSPPDSCCDGSVHFIDNEDEFYGTPMVEVVEDTEHRPNSSMMKSSSYLLSPDDRISNSQEIFGVPAKALEPEQYHKQVMATEVYGKEDMDASSQSSPQEMRLNLCRPKSQRRFFIDNLKQKDPRMMTLIKSQEISKNQGACCLVKQKVEKSWAIALLGLGFLDLGFNHDFFYGLIR
ncbi:hypothetical protein GOBAR_AA17089 [Gossypium barbadense]|uniref:Kinesin motor domain-containing protein n=1 Tax=Gossypium barbadense TaxID=3634 RepID=A0A2P5XJT3_GOSBA|nr:hypothetical protein GOBAR_AA17089 [Gossypium barbadense]